METIIKALQCILSSISFNKQMFSKSMSICSRLVSLYKPKFYNLIRLVYKFSEDTHFLVVILKFVSLKGLNCQDVNLQLRKSSSNAHPRPMREHNRGEGMGTVLLWTASQPSFRNKLIRIRELWRIFASNHDSVAKRMRNHNYNVSKIITYVKVLPLGTW